MIEDTFWTFTKPQIFQRANRWCMSHFLAQMRPSYESIQTTVVHAANDGNSPSSEWQSPTYGISSPKCRKIDVRELLRYSTAQKANMRFRMLTTTFVCDWAINEKTQIAAILQKPQNIFRRGARLSQY